MKSAPLLHIGNRSLSSLMAAICLQTLQQSRLSGPHDRDEGNSQKRGKRAGVLIRLRRRAFRFLPGFLPCIARTERKSSQEKAEVGASVSISTTRGVMKGTYTLFNPSAPLIWNFICFCRISRTKSDKSRFDPSMVETWGAEFHKTTAESHKSDPQPAWIHPDQALRTKAKIPGFTKL